MPEITPSNGTARIRFLENCDPWDSLATQSRGCSRRPYPHYRATGFQSSPPSSPPSDHIPSTTEIILQDDEISKVSTGMLRSGFFSWKVPFAEIDHLMKQGFQNCAAFFGNTELTSFQQRVKKAIAAYSQGVASYDVANRLIYAMSAAEHLLLRDASEPIQAGVGDRLAFVTASSVEERRAVVANFKKAYALRSKQVHHLAGVDDEEALTTFFRNMWVLLLQAIKSMPRFKEHSEFLDAIDRIKFA